MRVNIYLLVLVLGFKAAAGIIHEIVVEERKPVSLPCPRSVEGNVTWSREMNGHKTDILTVYGDNNIKHIDDPDKRYNSLADKSLVIKAVVSDAGRYFCNNKTAADLIPSGTNITTAPERTNVTLTCPHDVGASHVPTWSRDSGGIRGRFNVSSVDQTLTITDVRPSDSGLYYCDGKPAVYLNVTKAAPLPPWVYGVVVSILLLLLLLFLIIVYFTRRRFKRRGGGTLTAQAAAHSVADVSDGSNQHEPMYDTILDLPPVKKKTVTSLPNESPYSLVGYDCNNKGLSQLADDTYCLLGNTYCLLEKPKATANNQN